MRVFSIAILCALSKATAVLNPPASIKAGKSMQIRYCIYNYIYEYVCVRVLLHKCTPTYQGDSRWPIQRPFPAFFVPELIPVTQRGRA